MRLIWLIRIVGLIEVCAGSSCPAGKTGPNGQCSYCEEGKYKDNDGSHACIPCPAGFAPKAPWADYPLLADCDGMKGAEQVVWDDGRNCDRWDEYMKYSDPGVPAHVKSRCCIQQETPTVAVAVGLGVGGCVFLFLSCIAIYVCTRRKMQKTSTVLPTPMATAVIQQPVVGQSYISQSWVQQTGVEVTAETTPQQLPFQGQLAGAPDMSKSIMKFCER